jgi:hypothetical protein
MADTFTAKDASGTTVTFGSDDVSSVQYPRHKVVWGADGAVNDTSAAAPLPVAPQAAELHLGQIGAPGDVISVTPTLDTSAYASGDTLFDSTAVASAVRVSAGRAVLQSITVIDKDDQGVALDLFVFDSSVTFGTANAAPSISDADAAKCLGFAQVLAADYIDVGGAKIACVKNIGLPLEAASGTTLYIAAITRGTPTHTASGLVIRIGLLQD